MLQGNWSIRPPCDLVPDLVRLPDACTQAGIANPLLVTDRGLASLPVTLQALDILDAAGIGRACSVMSTQIPMRPILPLASPL